MRVPLVRAFALGAVLDLLLEHAELVVDAVAEPWKVETRHRVEEARGKTTEPAVAERGVGLGGQEVVEIGTHRVTRLARRLEQPEGDQVVTERLPHQVFRRQVVEALGAPQFDAALRVQQAVDQALAKRKGERAKQVVRRALGGRATERVPNVVPHPVGQHVGLGGRVIDGVGVHAHAPFGC